ncbi:6-pyruvoyl trahydropterin synthase family protein [Aureibacter tunicatorum]|uniref:6-carboxy-5,6,7,8-tetrahydropterin synthase n=1 Tax=Aureibacter tunicatorum TaxID=866807 RepID=A0AAE4BTN6_9BACT|nr:6-carboxytetrahydropterin synthase [Aureibacter tunicatorum]MDR6240881.1 6-pyruvoyltetrahydropterin/6-carboxytetrahydropterin synthase [Aureibacter tunicatorum]BDD03661.1 6-carboxy-5,6,7,8-tetrahydropterin synthase [Aureibacter tunicatorum]
MIYLSKELTFCAAHQLYNPKWSKEKNEEVFEGCAHENWHGHNYHLTVTVKGRPDEDTGMVMNFKDLKRIVKKEVISKVDHKNLNLDVDFMKGKMTTCEVLVEAMWGVLAPKISEFTDGRVVLHSLKLYETNTSFAEYYGE